MQRMKMLISLPFFNQGSIYAFDYESENVWRCNDDNSLFDYPLRDELSGYLWMIKDNFVYMKEV